MPVTLTDKQKKILKFIKSFSVKNGFPPTQQEIATEFDFSSANSARCHLEALHRKGAIVVNSRTPRGIKCLI